MRNAPTTAQLSWWVLFLALAGSCLFSHAAIAGGMRVIPGSISIEGGEKRAYKISSPISISFNVEDYEYGSQEYKYIFFALVPSNRPLSLASLRSFDDWTMFSQLARVPNSPNRDGLRRITV